MFFCKILWFTWCTPPVYPGCKRLNSAKHIIYYHPAENSVHSVHRCISGVFLRAIREIQGFYRRFLSKNLSKFVKICQNLSKILSKFVKICQNLSKFFKICQKWSKWDLFFSSVQLFIPPDLTIKYTKIQVCIQGV